MRARCGAAMRCSAAPLIAACLLGKQRVEKPLSATDEDQDPPEKDNVSNLCVSACWALPWVIALMMLASRLDGGPLAAQSLAVSPSPALCAQHALA